MSATLSAELRAALGGFDAGRAALAAGVAVTVLAGGGSNQTFRVTSAAGDWVVRLGGADDQAFGINRVAERQVHAVAARAGFAPPLLHVDEDQRVLIAAHLPGAPWTREQARSADGLRRIGARLAELHALPVPRGVRRLDIHAVLAHYLELKDVPPGPMSRADLAARLRWSLANYRPRPPALCHNDLHWRNFLGHDPLMFVDWEYGAVGDPLFELAAVVGYHDLDAGERAQLLAAYGGVLTPADLDPMCRVFDCLHALWLDTARGWDALEAPRRAALLARLAVDPAERGA
ncbi:MAG TPA: choline/ethanolamine kinase family protein [Steroidobacteraceae bacterium]|nr:choline/ethanolamine kinase family protein [Steroidobacteraceae bacterium]